MLKEAMAIYNSILKQRPEDPALIAILSNNILVLNGDRDVFDSKKKVKVLASEGASRKLTRLQKQKILFNRCLFALQTNQLEQCRELVARLKTAHTNSDLAILAQVALLNREKKTNVAMELLESHCKSYSTVGVQLYLTLAQLHLNQGNVTKVCSTLQSIPAFSRHVGVVATLASQHASLGAVGSAVAVLEQMLEHWMGRAQSQGEKSASTLTNLVKQVARFQLVHSQPQTAASTLEKALERQEDLEMRALLISAYSQYNPQRAEAASQDLPAFHTPGSGGVASLDVESLERTPVFRHSRKPAQDRTEVRSMCNNSKSRPQVLRMYQTFMELCETALPWLCQS